MISLNPAEDVKIAAELKAKGQKIRSSFNAEELNQLFTAPIYADVSLFIGGTKRDLR